MSSFGPTGKGIVIREAHFPGRAQIDAYGNGGFRFADMSHRGSLLLLPSGIYGWEMDETMPLSVENFRRVLDDATDIEVLLVGTGARLFASAQYTSGGKTGTAQAVSLGQNVKYNARLLEEHKRDHSLFAAFAPLEEPRIAVAVIVENAGFGAAAAGPIVRRVFDYWLMGQYPSEADLAAVSKGQATSPMGAPRKVEDVQILPTSAPPAP